MQNIAINLWFDTQAEEAAKLYTSLIPNSKMGKITNYPDGTPEEYKNKNTNVVTVELVVNGINCIFLNGGPGFKLNEAFSFVLNVDSQEEVDKYWNVLIADGGEESQCGWCKDKFGVSWQVIPKQLYELMDDPDPKKSDAVTQCMFKQTKIIVADLQKAYDEA